MAAIDIASIGLTKTNLLSGGMTFIVFIIFILLASAGIGFVMWLSRYRMMIFVEERRGNSVIEYLTRGGIIVNNKSGVKELVVWRGKWNWNLPLRSEVPDNKYFRINSKGAKFLRIIKDSVDTFKVVTNRQINHSKTFQIEQTTENKHYSNSSNSNNRIC